MFTKSIRLRLLLWLAFLLVCILSGFGITAYQLHRTNQFTHTDQELQKRVAALATVLRRRSPPELRPGFPPPYDRRERPPFDDRERGPRGRPGRPEREPGGPDNGPGLRELRLPSQVLNLFDEADTNGFYFVIWNRSGVLLKSSTNAPADIPRPVGAGSEVGPETRMRGAFRESFQLNSPGECILAGRSIAADLATLRAFAWWLALVGGVVLTVGLGGSWCLATRALRPVEEISTTASRISEGNLSERINVADTDGELGRLAGVLNSTFARLEAAFAQQKQFTADASHELRTPLAVIISETQTTLARERPSREYREALESCLEAAQQMRRLTDSLLELARFDAGQDPFLRCPLDLAEITRACLDLIRPLAAQRGIQIQSDLGPANAVGDNDRLSQVITNLLTNAIYYNKDNGEIRVSTGTENGTAIVTVADSGEGIAAEDLPHIFERFYRVDKSRSRLQGGNGLGLAICKTIVDAQGGTIEVTSQPGAGTTFSVRLLS